MDLVIEIMAELVLEIFDSGAKEVALGKKYPKPLRITAVVLLLVFYLAVFGLIAFAGILFLKESVVAGILFIGLDVFLIVLSVRRVVKAIRRYR